MQLDPLDLRTTLNGFRLAHPDEAQEIAQHLDGTALGTLIAWICGWHGLTITDAQAILAGA